MFQFDHLNVARKVAQFYSLTEAQFYQKGLTRNSSHKAIIKARQNSMWIFRNIGGMSYPDIGRAFLRHHTTVIQACREVSKKLRKFPKYADELDELVRFVDPSSHILETTYHFTLVGDHDIKKLHELSENVLHIAESKEISTILVTFKLLRGSPPPGIEREDHSEDENDQC